MGCREAIVYSKPQQSEAREKKGSSYPIRPTTHTHTHTMSGSVPIHTGKIQHQLSLISGSFLPKFLNPVPRGPIQQFTAPLVLVGQEGLKQNIIKLALPFPQHSCHDSLPVPKSFKAGGW